MLPTGGTTGHPKVARLTNRAMVASCVSSRMALDYRKGDRAMISLPLFHVGGLFVGVGACLSAGTTIVIPGPAGARDPALITNFWTIIEKYRLTHAGNVPTTLGALADIPVGDCDISSLRVTPTGASICPPEIERRYLATWGGPCVQQVYGMTELAGAITHDVAGVKPRPESVGTRNPMVELAILASDGLHKGPWPSPVGELLTRGPQVFPGYVDQKQTEEAFHQGWLRTGDICRIDADGFVYIMGRAKDVIIRGGHNIDPRAIEDAALGFPGVALAAAVGRPDAYAGEVPMLFVSAQPGVMHRSAGARRLRAGQDHGAAGAAARGLDHRRNAGHAGRQDLQAEAARDRGRRSRARIAGRRGPGERRQCRGDHRSLPRALPARQGHARQGSDGAAPAAEISGEDRA